FVFNVRVDHMYYSFAIILFSSHMNLSVYKRTNTHTRTSGKLVCRDHRLLPSLKLNGTRA
ncbi:hypothetical protein RDWZM_009177, partial [Blomia tropicalis]